MILWTDESGQDLVEYALVVAAVGLALLTTVAQLSQTILNVYENLAAQILVIGVIQ